MTATPGPDDAVTFAEYTEPVPYTAATPRPGDIAEARACLESARGARPEVVGQYLDRATALATVAIADALTALADRPQFTAELGEVGEISDDALYAAAAAVAADLLEMDAAEDIRLDKWAAAEELVRLVHPNALRFTHVDAPTPQEPVADERQWRRAIADQVRRNCTLPTGEILTKPFPGDQFVNAVADWIENPPEWSQFDAPTQP